MTFIQPRALDGDLGRIEQVVKLTGIVNGTPDFESHGAVVDGCSQVLQVEVKLANYKRVS